jgi:CRP/FNR family transcriptional regulator, cyclic AMP receptor protein
VGKFVCWTTKRILPPIRSFRLWVLGMSPLSQTRLYLDYGPCLNRVRGMFCNLSLDTLADFNIVKMFATHIARTIRLRDDPNSGLYVVCSGTLKPSCTSKEGKALILRIASARDALGLAPVACGSPYEVTAGTLRPTILKKIDRSELQKFHERHGEISRQEVKSLFEEYSAIFLDVCQPALSGFTAGKMAAIFLGLERAAILQMLFTMAVTREQSGNLTSATRETVTCTFNKLQRKVDSGSWSAHCDRYA